MLRQAMNTWNRTIEEGLQPDSSQVGFVQGYISDSHDKGKGWKRRGPQCNGRLYNTYIKLKTEKKYCFRFHARAGGYQCCRDDGSYI